MKVTNDELWLFDYDEGMSYEAFSKCEDSGKQVMNYLAWCYCLRDQVVLEIGAGSGKFTSFLASRCRTLHAVERSESLMRINQAKNEGVDNIYYHLCDVKDMTFPMKSIDVIFGGWSLTSMRDSFGQILPVLKRVLKDDGIVVLVENAGGDEFSEIVGIEELSQKMRDFYKSIGFKEKALFGTTIALPSEAVFYAAFPNKADVRLKSLTIQHEVLILEAAAKDFYKGGGCE